MAKKLTSNFSFFRIFDWKLLVISAIIVGGGAYLLKDRIHPYQFNVLERVPQDVSEFRTYHDFNGDGLSECIRARNAGPNKYDIQIESGTGGIVDQTNYAEGIMVDGWMFGDVTGDGYQELIAFTQKGDSVFLYVHDLIAKQPVIKRLFLFCAREPLTPHSRQVDILPGFIADRSVYQHKVILFGARSFYALWPRTIFAFDLEDRKLIHEFDTHSVLGPIVSYDLNGDRVDEIIVGGLAYGNVHYDAPYRDDRCWLFVLDQRLNPLFPPLSFSEYPSEFACLPVEDHSEKYILAAPDYLGEKNLHDYLYLIDAHGKIHLRTNKPYDAPPGESLVAGHLKNPTEIYAGKGDNQLIKLNQKLETVRQVSTPYSKIKAIAAKDVDADGREELVCASEKSLLVYDDNLTLLADYPFPAPFGRTCFREMGKDRPVEIGLTAGGSFYLLSLSHHGMYPYLPFALVGLTGLLFVLLTGSQRLLFLTAHRNRMLKFVRFDTSEGVLVIDHQCFIIFCNDKFAQLLNLPHPPARGEYAVSILHHPRITRAIEKSIAQNERVDERVLPVGEEGGFAGEVSVQPYRYMFKRKFNYLVILRSGGIPSHSNQIHSWSKAVQKMAHDMKTPLSTVSLNLKVLQTRLERYHLSETEHRDITDDIQMIRTELDTIQSVTRNFLKFSNLDKPHVQAFDIRTAVDGATRRFQAYLNADFSIDVSIDNDAKPVSADPQQIEMVFTVLIENALSAMQGKGLISIHVSLVQLLPPLFPECLEIEVADTGPGVREEERERIFEPYFTTKPEGTGMGLAIAKKILQDNGGSIEVYSKPHFGAVFRFSVPVSKE